MLRVVPLLALPFVSGCLVVPIPANRYDPVARQNVKPETLKRLTERGLTRADVVLKLGEPDEISADEGELRFHSQRVKWDIIWIVGGYGTAAGGDIEIKRYYDLVARFDEEGKLAGVSWMTGSNPSHLHEKSTSRIASP